MAGPQHCHRDGVGHDVVSFPSLRRVQDHSCRCVSRELQAPHSPELLLPKATRMPQQRTEFVE
jgi:hypothetical protein